MNQRLLQIQQELLATSFVNDLVCFVVFGSSVYVDDAADSIMDPSRPTSDSDVCVVVKSRSTDLVPIANFLFSTFQNPDFTIYFEDEVNSNLPFRDIGTGLFALEYLSQGVFLYGQNIFSDKLKKIDPLKYKETILEKIFDYILRLRNAYLGTHKGLAYRLDFFTKYVLRLLTSIMLLRGYASYVELMHMSKQDILELARKHGIISSSTNCDFTSLQKLYEIYQEINIYVVNMEPLTGRRSY